MIIIDRYNKKIYKNDIDITKLFSNYQIEVLISIPITHYITKEDLANYIVKQHNKVYMLPTTITNYVCSIRTIILEPFILTKHNVGLKLNSKIVKIIIE